MSLAGQRLHKAFAILREKGNKREQLTLAFKDQILRLRLEDFPVELRKDFADLIARMCKSGLHNPATYCRQQENPISDNEIDLMIEMIAALYINIANHQPQYEAARKAL